MIAKRHHSPHGGKIRTVSLKFTSNVHLVGAVFVYSSLVALIIQFSAAYCKTVSLKLTLNFASPTIRVWKFRLAQVIQTTVVTLPVYNRHQEQSFF